ncbi:transcriptional regulator [Vibrio owensii]|uniref:LysR family transcriptional regulator n=1 Tax=Vibrio TaxID=662 RepID=UPI00028C9B5A|nr:MULTISPECIES: LysR family transcriptional regulator [Vibrio]EKM24808.1 bacterial regulatory helix-turn-helix, lysR family protein [Vibrio sp. HENC-03]MDK9779079.1 LysR family transcriptional regulator [Vibrio sp. D401a]MDK9807096.1 LysR family transcriptional regulator [Vibrio sp. D406a]CAH1588826.1 Bacterial regulatory helix-turn-helix, lysR family protein [Vibrio owensii]SUP93076.1 transcriptional regulator [Vibrio owensii]
MDLANKLELLLEVSKAGSFAKAADRMNMDRSVLSKHIKQLEEYLGVRLVNRTTRSLSMTQIGLQVIEKAEQISTLLDETKQLTSSFQTDLSGNLKISSSTMFGRQYLQPAIQRFLEQFPKASIELLLDDHHVDVVGNNFDIAFRIGPMRDSTLVAKRLAENKVAIVASQSFIEKHGEPKTPQALSLLPSIVYANGNFNADKLKFISKTEPDQLDVYSMTSAYRVNEPELIIESAKAGLGYAQIGQFMVHEELESMGLVQLLADYDIPTHGDIYAMYTHRQHSPLLKEFIDIVQDVIGTPANWEAYFR